MTQAPVRELGASSSDGAPAAVIDADELEAAIRDPRVIALLASAREALSALPEPDSDA